MVIGVRPDIIGLIVTNPGLKPLIVLPLGWPLSSSGKLWLMAHEPPINTHAQSSTLTFFKGTCKQQYHSHFLTATSISKLFSPWLFFKGLHLFYSLAVLSRLSYSFLKTKLVGHCNGKLHTRGSQSTRKIQDGVKYIHESPNIQCFKTI